jgi:hypothetical protein
VRSASSRVSNHQAPGASISASSFDTRFALLKMRRIRPASWRDGTILFVIRSN